MTQETRDTNRQIVADRIELHREERNLKAINERLKADEDAYRAEINRQMDSAYLFDTINNHSKEAVKLYDADDGWLLPIETPKEWWDEYPQLWGVFCGAGTILAILIVVRFVLEAFGLW